MSDKVDKGKNKSKKAGKAKTAGKAKKAKQAIAELRLAEQRRLRAEVTVLRFLVDRMLLAQARNLGKEAYLEDLHKNLMGDLDRAGEADQGSEIRDVMNAEIERSLEVVRTQLVLARADRSKRN